MRNKEEKFITKKIDVWSSAIKSKSNLDRGSNKKLELYGIDKMRDLILELACKGLLVKAEKCSVVELNEVAEIIMGQAPAGKDCNLLGEGTVFVKTGQFGALYPEKNEWTTNPLKFAKRGDVLICVVGATIGKLNLGIDCAIGRSVSAIRPNVGLNSKYLYYSLLPYTLKLRRRSRGSAQGVIGKSELNSITIRFPHIAEQNLIVEKVEELMRLCDQLEHKQESKIKTHNNLVTSLLDALCLSIDNPTQFACNWELIQEKFDILFTTENSIDKLKQTILKLAVMGKLVQQDPRDEPAKDLFKKITEKKEKLIEKGLLKKQKQLPSISEKEKTYQIPENWSWFRLNDAFDIRDGTHDSPRDAIGENTFPLITTKDFKNGKIDFTGAKRISSEDHFKICRRSYVEVNDILFSMIGSIGNQVIVEDPRPFSVKNVALLKFYSQELTVPRFLKIYTEELAFGLKQKASGAVQPFISLGFLRNLPFALPPTAEQHRIVSKVDELMKLCEKLKTSIASAETKQLNFADSLIDLVLR